jgi:hypothetical protein
MVSLGKIKLVEICPACELLIKEKLSRSHFITFKSVCMVYTNNNIPEMTENNIFLQEVYDLEKAKYLSTLEVQGGDIKIRPNGRFELTDSVDGYCIDSMHRFK